MNKEKLFGLVSFGYTQLKLIYHKITHVNRKNTIIFVICLGVSTAMWLLMSLSETYVASVKVPVEFSNFPKDKIVISTMLKEVEMDVEAAGFSLVSYRLFSSFNPLHIDLSLVEDDKTDKKITVSSQFIKEKLSQQLSSQDRLIRLKPETIQLEYSQKEYKKVPVVVHDSLQFRKQYFLDQAVQVMPDSVELFGPRIILDKINKIETAVVHITDVHQTLSKDIVVAIPDSLKDLSINVKTVKATWLIDQYTEGNCNLAITSKGLPRNQTVKFFPDSVRITYQVGLNHFDQINPNMFVVEADFSDSLTWKNRAKIRLKTVQAPSTVTYSRIQPAAVEFLFKENN
ncbi:MAG: YbbR domain-containing protein [Flavobacteriales bacterium]|jgi:YbbR domain-containing protein